MVQQLKAPKKIEERLRSRIESERTAMVERITTRECSSDKHRGLQVNIYGPVVPIRPLIDFVAEEQSIAIEHLHHYADGEEPFLGVFIAYVSQEAHPAFV